MEVTCSTVDILNSVHLILLTGYGDCAVQCKRSFVFDHLWGIPGETGDREVAMLQDICKRQGEVRRMCIKCGIIYLVMHR